MTENTRDLSSSPLIAALAKALAASEPAPDPEAQRLAALRERYRFLLHPDWPEARWDVSGAFLYDRELTLFHDFFLGGHGLRLLSVVHGAPLCLWNGGRVKWQFRRTPRQVEAAIQEYARRQIPMDVTFSNTMLEPAHLEDAFGNSLLEQVEQANPTGRNAVIIASDLLSDYVRKRHPRIRQVASVVKATEEDGQGRLDYYRRMAERFDKVMVHPDDNFDLELLARLEDKDRYEILVNEPCLRHCQRRKTHYRLLSQFSLNLLDTEVEYQLTTLLARNGCSDPERLLLSQDRRTLTLSSNEIKALYGLGFRNFKVQGRGQVNPTFILLELARLMFTRDPDHDHLVARSLAEFINLLPAKTGGRP